MNDFYPVLGWAAAPSLRDCNSSQYQHWTKIGLPKKSNFQYGMRFSIENGFFIPSPSLAAEKQGLGLNISIENENFKPRIKLSSENVNLCVGNEVFFFLRVSENYFCSISGPSGES